MLFRSGSYSEAMDIAIALENSGVTVFLNDTPTDTIDLLIVFNAFNNESLPFITSSTVALILDDSVSIDNCEVHRCSLEDDNVLKLKDEIKTISHQFHKAYGILALANIKVIFSEKKSTDFFDNLLAASSVGRTIEKEKVEEKKVVYIDHKNQVFHLIIALDCTGSMERFISNLKNSLISIVKIIQERFPKIVISFYGFRDYLDNPIVRKTIFQKDVNNIIDAISKEVAHGGDDCPEAHKTCLLEIYNDIQTKVNMTPICILISDAPPHNFYNPKTNEDKLESRSLKSSKFAYDWILLSKKFQEIGCQVFSFIPNNNDKRAILSMSAISQITNGLAFCLPKDKCIFKDQVLSIFSGLLNIEDIKIVDGIKMYDFPNGEIKSEKELYEVKEMSKTIEDTEVIKANIRSIGALMRLDPSSRGAKRVIITTDDLVITGNKAIDALKAFYKICQGNYSEVKFFLSENKNSFLYKIGEELKANPPNVSWFSSSSIECLCSGVRYVDSFQMLLDYKQSNDIIEIFNLLGNFVIGYPFLFELSPTGKFDMQDAWPINLKNVTTAYTLSMSSLYDILENNGTEDSIGKFRDLISFDSKSGIVPICIPGDMLGVYITKILDATKWLDALVSYGLHRHIEPLPSITRASCCSFIVTICKNSFLKGNLSSSEKEAISNILTMMESMVSLGCKEIAEEFKSSFKEKIIPYNALSPQAPYNCSSINKILNVVIQLKNEFRSLENDYALSVFHQIIYDIIGMMTSFIKEAKLPSLIHKIFDVVEVDVKNIQEQNPLESSNVEKLSNQEIRICSDHKIIKFSIFLMKTIWNFIFPSVEFVSPTDLHLTAAFALALIMFPRSTKYISQEKDTSILNPKYTLEDPRKTLLNLIHMYSIKVKIEDLLTLQENRRIYLKNEIIKNIVIAFRNCDIEELFLSLKNGTKMAWMKRRFRLEMKDTKDIFYCIIKFVNHIEPKCDEFYNNVLRILTLGKIDKMTWQINKTFRDVECIKSYIKKFLHNDEDILNKITSSFGRPTANRHCHHYSFCPFQDYYTEEYARSRLICSFAQFYFVDSLPHCVEPINKEIIFALSKKAGAPSYSKIAKFAEEIHNEMTDLVNEVEKR